MKMRRIFTSLALLISVITYSQTGIGTVSPKATLDIVGKPHEINTPDGVIAPRLTGNQLAAKNKTYGIEQTGVLVYVTEVPSDANRVDKTVNVDKPGYYMFNGTTWKYAFGGDEEIEIGELVYYQVKPFLASVSGGGDHINGNNAIGWMSYYDPDIPILGGKIRLDAYFALSSNYANGGVTMQPRLVNVSDQPVKIWFSAMTTVNAYNAGNYLMAANGGWVNLDDGIYYGYGYNDILGTSTPRQTGVGAGGHQEVVQVDLALDNRWYRIYYFPTVDNLNTTSNNDNLRKIYISIQRLY